MSQSKWSCVLLLAIGILYCGQIQASEKTSSVKDRNPFANFDNKEKGRILLPLLLAPLLFKNVAATTVAAVAATTPSATHPGSCSNLPRTSTCGVNDVKCTIDANCTANRKCCRQRGVMCCVDASDMCGALTTGNVACSDLIRLNPARECHDDFDCGYGVKCCSDGQSHHKCCSAVPAVCQNVAGKCPKSKQNILSCSRSSDCGAGAKCCDDGNQNTCCTSITGICSKFGTINCTYPNGPDAQPVFDNCARDALLTLPAGYNCNMFASRACCVEPGGAHACCVGWDFVCNQRREAAAFQCGGRHTCGGLGQNENCHDTEFCCADSAGVNCCVSKYL